MACLNYYLKEECFPILNTYLLYIMTPTAAIATNATMIKIAKAAFPPSLNPVDFPCPPRCGMVTGAVLESLVRERVVISVTEEDIELTDELLVGSTNEDDVITEEVVVDDVSDTIDVVTETEVLKNEDDMVSKGIFKVSVLAKKELTKDREWIDDSFSTFELKALDENNDNDIDEASSSSVDTLVDSLLINEKESYKIDDDEVGLILFVSSLFGSDVSWDGVDVVATLSFTVELFVVGESVIDITVDVDVLPLLTEDGSIVFADDTEVVGVESVPVGYAVDGSNKTKRVVDVEMDWYAVDVGMDWYAVDVTACTDGVDVIILLSPTNKK